ncbi:MAG TPA: mechanosensitive ion channel family protein, partial [Gemmatimonadales bacterium]|nr:mechanosensitive ion channel family protein [Gemmatimonadales bacterium]
MRAPPHPVPWLDRLTDFLGLGDAELTAKLLQAAIILALAWGSYRLLRVVAKRIERAAKDHALSEAEQRGHTLARLILSFGTVLIAVAALMMILGLFINIAPLLAAASLAGIGISFGAQSLVKDLIAGFFIVFENQCRLGDVVRIAGVEGTVSHMSLRCTVLRDGQGVVHFVPNGQITVVSNETRQWSRALLDVSVPYSANIDRVIDVLRAMLAGFAAEAIWKDVVVGEPTVAGVQRLGDTAVEVRLWVNTIPGKQGDAARELRRRVMLAFEKEGIALPVPPRVV